MGSIREYEKEDGSVSYHAEVRLRGHPPQRANFRTRSLAKKWIQDTESAIRDGRHFRTAEAKRHSVKELIDRFIKQWLPKYPKRQAKQTALLTWWKDRIGNVLLSDLTPALIAEARDTLLNEKTSRKSLRNPSTVNRYLAAFSKALTVAVKEWGWLDDSPMRKVSKPSESSGRSRFLSIEEKDKLLAVCKTSSNPYLYPIVSLALVTGMRFGEIIGLTWENIDFNQNLITLELTKNGERRVIPLTQSIKAILNSIQTSDQLKGPLFKSNRYNNKSGNIAIRNAFLKALQLANIKNFRFHDLRHTAASYLAMQGATQGELMAILGHKTPAMTRRYAHYSQDHIRKILEKISNNLI
jgi:integrase